MNDRTCSIEGCNKRVNSRGWCKMHYSRWTRTGDPLVTRRKGVAPTAVELRLAPKIQVDQNTGCWNWTGHVNRYGYGWARGEAKSEQVHRIVYRLAVGEIPAGLHIDHLCRNTRCCNPRHLEAVTPRENALRGVSPLIKLHLAGVCGRGHVLAEEGCYVKGKLAYCRACRREKRREAKEAR